MENTASTVTLNTGRKGKQISSHITEDGINYHGPECRKVSAKKSDGSGRRKQWSKCRDSLVLEKEIKLFLDLFLNYKNSKNIPQKSPYQMVTLFRRLHLHTDPKTHSTQTPHAYRNAILVFNNEWYVLMRNHLSHHR